MWFLWFWLINFIMCYGYTYVWSKALVSELKKKYIFPKMKFTIWERLSIIFSGILIWIVPLLNILMLFVNLFNNDHVKETITEKFIIKYNLKPIE